MSGRRPWRSAGPGSAWPGPWCCPSPRAASSAGRCWRSGGRSGETAAVLIIISPGLRHQAPDPRGRHADHLGPHRRQLRQRHQVAAVGAADRRLRPLPHHPGGQQRGRRGHPPQPQRRRDGDLTVAAPRTTVEPVRTPNRWRRRRPVATPRRIRTFTTDDWLALGGSILASLRPRLRRLPPHPRLQRHCSGFLVCWYFAFLVHLRRVVVAVANPRPIVVERLVAAALYLAAAVVSSRWAARSSTPSPRAGRPSPTSTSSPTTWPA